MSPIGKYYAALLCFVVAIGSIFAVPSLLPGTDGVDMALAFPVALLCWIYMAFVVRCPRCGWRLSAARRLVSHGFPGRRCDACDHDLGAPPPKSPG